MLTIKPKHIKQIGSNSCGVASICMVTGKSRSAVIEALEFQQDSKSLWTMAKDLRKALNSFNYTMSKQFFCNDWGEMRKVQGIAILAVNFSAETGNFHWIVWDGNDLYTPILDPLADNRKPINARTKLISYFKIERI